MRAYPFALKVGSNPLPRQRRFLCTCDAFGIGLDLLTCQWCKVPIRGCDEGREESGSGRQLASALLIYYNPAKAQEARVP
jgi:hypothetical protein